MGRGTGDWEPWRKGGGGGRVQERGKDGAGSGIPKMVGKGRNGKNYSQHCAPSLLPAGERGRSQQKKGQELKLRHTRSRMFRPLPPPIISCKFAFPQISCLPLLFSWRVLQDFESHPYKF